MRNEKDISQAVMILTKTPAKKLTSLYLNLYPNSFIFSQATGKRI